MLHSDVGHTQAAKRQILEIFSQRDEVFATPKPSSLIEHVLRIATDPGDIILDSFAGSGTTGHAVLELNKADGGNRKFILVEMEQDIARGVTAERLRRVINGYDKGGDPEKPVEGLGGGFRYCTLGTPLFDEYGNIGGDVAFPDLAAHIFFSATGVPLPAKVDGSSPYIGRHHNQALFLLYKAEAQGFASNQMGNVLTPDILDDILAHELPNNEDASLEVSRLVFGEGCTVSDERLKAHGVEFRQIPYQIAAG